MSPKATLMSGVIGDQSMVALAASPARAARHGGEQAVKHFADCPGQVAGARIERRDTADFLRDHLSLVVEQHRVGEVERQFNRGDCRDFRVERQCHLRAAAAVGRDIAVAAFVDNAFGDEGRRDG
eukprot:gene27479-33161_t